MGLSKNYRVQKKKKLIGKGRKAGVVLIVKKATF